MCNSKRGGGLACPRRAIEKHMRALPINTNTCYCYYDTLGFDMIIIMKCKRTDKGCCYIWSFEGVGEDSNDLFLVSHVLHLLWSTDQKHKNPLIIRSQSRRRRWLFVKIERWMIFEKKKNEREMSYYFSTHGWELCRRGAIPFSFALFPRLWLSEINPVVFITLAREFQYKWSI